MRASQSARYRLSQSRAAHGSRVLQHDMSMRSFNTEGPIDAQDHYCIPPLERVDLDHVLNWIHQEEYFVLHAPRQTGKTSTLLALQDLLNSGTAGAYRCVYVNLEASQAAREDVGRAMLSILDELALRAELVLNDEFVRDTWRDALEMSGPLGALKRVLTEWSLASPHPLVLLVDEIDALVGDTLISVLRQLRSGYDRRPASYPQSVVLCGVRDVRDYRIHSSSKTAYVGVGGVFNISAGSLRLGDFTEVEVGRLLEQHTTETGQGFLPEALDRVWTQTLGQPWLVNALCDRSCFRRDQAGGGAVTEDDVWSAQEQLILDRVVHLDQLTDKLRDGRVRRVIEPMLSGNQGWGEPTKNLAGRHDLEYVRELGLIARDGPLRIANPIYAEAVTREMTAAAQGELPQEPARYVDAGHGLNAARLLADFQDFFRQHSEHWLKRFDYEEAAPQLLLQAFLQRIAPWGGRIAREYGLGRGRTDLLIVWPRDSGEQRFVVECKILRQDLESTIRSGLSQAAEYMDRCAAEEGHLVIFDREKRLWKDKAFQQNEVVNGLPIYVWGM